MSPNRMNLWGVLKVHQMPDAGRELSSGNEESFPLKRHKQVHPLRVRGTLRRFFTGRNLRFILENIQRNDCRRRQEGMDFFPPRREKMPGSAQPPSAAVHRHFPLSRIRYRIRTAEESQRNQLSSRNFPQQVLRNG